MGAYTTEDIAPGDGSTVHRWTPVAVVAFATVVVTERGASVYECLCLLPDGKMISVSIYRLHFTGTPQLKALMAEATLVKQDGVK